MEKDFELFKQEVGDEFKKCDTRIKILEDNVVKVNIDMALMQKDQEYVKKSVDNIERIANSTNEKIDRLSNQRLEDHYIKPIENGSKLKWAIITSVAIMLITSVVTTIVTLLKN